MLVLTWLTHLASALATSIIALMPVLLQFVRPAWLIDMVLFTPLFGLRGG